MNDDSPKTQGRADSRREREADALRANLRRRKEQQRARETPARELPARGEADDAPPNNNPDEPRDEGV